MRGDRDSTKGWVIALKRRSPRRERAKRAVADVGIRV